MSFHQRRYSIDRAAGGGRALARSWWCREIVSPEPRSSAAGAILLLSAAVAGCTPTGLLLQLIDPLRRFGLAEVFVEVLLGFLRQGLQVGALGPRHRLIAGGPVIGVLDGVAFVSELLSTLVGHVRVSCRA